MEIKMDKTNPGKNKKLVWIDLEMTGLDTQRDNIIEIATIITDYELNIIAEGPEMVIHQTNEIMSRMDSWNTQHHNDSGLTNKVLKSRITTELAEIETIKFLKQYLKSGESPICGNTICQDRRFLARQMPELESFFHYRNLDVSSIKILAQMWNPRILSEVNKESKHRALDDIKDSINELAIYRSYLFNSDCSKG
jgi:oligoribonuclease